MKQIALTTIALSLMAAPAFAGPASDAATARIKAIAEGDVAAVTSAYGADATLYWNGGPLDGVYTSGEERQQVWTKFTGAQGKLKADINDLAENANPKGGTVTANVVFEGKSKIPVRYVMTFREGKLVGEIWQIDPKILEAY